MNPSFFSKPAVFASIGDAEGAGAVAAGWVEDAQPAMTPAAAAIESIDALFIGFAFEDGRLSDAADLCARGNGSLRGGAQSLWLIERRGRLNFRHEPADPV